MTKENRVGDDAYPPHPRQGRDRVDDPPHTTAGRLPSLKALFFAIRLHDYSSLLPTFAIPAGASTSMRSTRCKPRGNDVPLQPRLA